MVSTSNNVLGMFFRATCVCPNQVAIELDDQYWTYSELLANVFCVSNHLKLVMSEIVYQYVDRSLEMVCGLLGIMCAGGVYYPLNPAEPIMRIRLLINQSQGRLVLVHGNTHDRFSSIDCQQVKVINLQEILMMNVQSDFVERGNCLVSE